MIESIVSPEILEKKPWKAFIAGFIFTLVAILLAGNVGSPSPYGHGVGYLVVAFISVAAAPFFVHIFKIEERKRGNIFQRHEKIIRVYAWFFLSVIIASSFFYSLNPTVAEKIFTDQLKELENAHVIQKSAASGMATKSLSFVEIFENNLIVLGLAIVFSFVLGAGAVFLISWNATLIGTLIGKISQNPSAFGLSHLGNPILNYVVALPLTLLTLLPHGIFEIGAYFFGAVAGGILSAALIQERYKSWEHYKPIIEDVGFYSSISVIMIFIGALIEVYL
ncbi:hypothetical protein DRN74_01950 [Candidatus Micrarchaeota archaeon]|nr:MAG: hypothetical protein DRN74_01950 [Candidatus Micrarchaeota archaeon]